MRANRLRTALIISVAVALALGVLTAFVVFYPIGAYGPIGPDTSIITPSATSTNVSAGAETTSSTNAFATTTGNTSPNVSLPGGNVPGQFSSTYSSPYPVTWNEGNEQFAITGASFADNALTLDLSIQTGNVSECVPLNIRIVKDEYGNLQAPDTLEFSFPDTGNCNGQPNETYSEEITFTVDPSITSPFLLTTGGNSNIFFNIATSTTGGVDISLPSHSG